MDGLCSCPSETHPIGAFTGTNPKSKVSRNLLLDSIRLKPQFILLRCELST